MTTGNMGVLRGLIYEKCGNQIAFSKKIGWHPNKVSALLNEKYIPDVNEAAQIFRILELTKKQYVAIFLPMTSPNGDNAE